MTAMLRYGWDSAEYAEAFATLLRSYGSRESLYTTVRGLLVGDSDDLVAIDLGAGTGDLTRLLLEVASTVYAVEPSPTLRVALAANCPTAQIIDGTIMTVDLPRPANVALLSHVLYHIPDFKWGAHVIRAANCLLPDGVLLVVLKDPDSGCNRMLEHFGAPRFDLFSGLATVARKHKEFDFTFSHSPHTISMNSFEETLQVARFMMADRAEDSFSRQPMEEQFVEYVKTHLWDDAKSVGGWYLGDVYCLIRRNTRWVATE